MAREARLSHDWCHLKEYFKLRKWHQNHQNLVRFRTVPEARVLGIQEDTLWMIHSTLPDIIWTEARSYGTFRLHFWMMGIICFNNIHLKLNACFRFLDLVQPPISGWQSSLSLPDLSPYSLTWQVSKSSQERFPCYHESANTGGSLSIYSSPVLVLNSCWLYYWAFISQTVTVHMHVRSVSFSSQAKTKLCLSVCYCWC